MAKDFKLRPYHLETLALHGGTAPDPATGARAVPIYQTTSFVFRNTQHAQELFSLDEAGNIYSRIGNPSVDVLEKRVSLMEGGVAAVATASGQSATTAAITNLCRAGDEVIASSALYGGTFTLLSSTLYDLGITVRFANTLNEARFLSNPRTRAVFLETIANPKLEIPDLKAWADFAHSIPAPLVVDNTFATPMLCRPLEHGADVVIHSLTKWIGGHGAALGGIVVDGGRFDFDTPRYPQFSEPDASYHDIRYAKEMGSLAYSTRLRVKLLRDMGASLAPMNAFLILLGIETLGIRIERMSQTALELATRLEKHPDVSWVNYPGLPDHPSYSQAKEYFSTVGFGAMLNFGIKGGKTSGLRFINGLGLWSHVANVGDARSLAIHPASTTHQQLSEEAQRAAGVSPELIRLSVGLEHVDDLWEDIVQSLDHAHGRPRTPAILNDEAIIRQICLASHHPDGHPITLAVVGLSPNPGRPSYRTSRKLKRLGYRIVPVNPRFQGAILDEPVYPNLSSIPFPVDVVQIFRQSGAALGIVQETIQTDTPIVWLQEGVINHEAAELASRHHRAVVMNRCVFKEIQRYRGSIVTYPATIMEGE